MSLFSELIPARLESLEVRLVDPRPGAVTSYEVSFSADGLFEEGDVLEVIFPEEIQVQGEIEGESSSLSTLRTL